MTQRGTCPGTLPFSARPGARMDMIHPKQGGRITLRDLKRCKLGLCALRASHLRSLGFVKR